MIVNALTKFEELALIGASMPETDNHKRTRRIDDLVPPLNHRHFLFT